jgi:gamma-glutamyltranspeptidase/glutathione hydrolase
MALNLEFGRVRAEADGAHGMVTGTSGALAEHAGLQALKAGGTAADAAVTTALAQIALAGGSWVSYAGILSGLYYEAATGKIHTISGTFVIPKTETDPMTIPPGATVVGHPSGRSAMVPGFMAAVQAMHDRFGKLPFATLFEPAIYIAEHGMLVDSHFQGMLTFRRDVLSRLPETRAVFLKPDGSSYKTGELFQQPALAVTLRAIAKDGAEYMYRGPWAKRFVDAVQRDGGKITLEDMAAYRAPWGEPIQTRHFGYDVYTANSLGGTATLGALNVIEAANLAKLGHPSTSAEALYAFVNAITAPNVANLRAPSTVVTQYLGGVDLLAPGALLDKAKARQMWQLINSPAWEQFMAAATAAPATPANRPGHSDAVIVVDAQGNIAALTHSINTVTWGTTGIVVDGITIPDAASFQQVWLKAAIKADGPGARFPIKTIIPIIVLKDGKPVLGASSIGSGLFEITLQGLVNILDYGMGPQTALDTAMFVEHMLPPTQSLIPNTAAGLAKQGGATGTAAESVVAQAVALAKGRRLDLGGALGFPPGYSAAITIDPVTHRLRGASSRQLNGVARGY